MFKKPVLFAIAILSAFTLSAQAAWRNNDITMLVMPREAVPLQIAQDISRRYPVLIVSYQITRSGLKLYAWNGDSWVFVPVEDYTSGTFFANRPKHAIVVENERLQAPAVLTPNSVWCESASRLTSTDTRVLLHLLGLHFDFPFRYWKQFSERSGYPIEQINPTLHNVHWWSLRTDVLIEKRSKRDFSIDLDKWKNLPLLPPPVIVPVKMGTEPAPEPAVVKPAVPKKTEAGAAAVDITVKAPETPVKQAPVVPTNSVDIKPAPAPELIVVPPPTEAPAPVVNVEKVPVAEPAPAPLIESAPIIHTALTNGPALPVPATEPEITPAAAVEFDPFSADEIPAAEIVIPPEAKKPWWKRL